MSSAPLSNIVTWSANMYSVGSVYTFNRTALGEFTQPHADMVQSIISIRVVNSDTKPYTVNGYWWDPTTSLKLGNITPGFVLIPPMTTLYLKGASEYVHHEGEIKFQMGGQSSGPNGVQQNFLTVTVTASYAYADGRRQ
jgi:hypothetical protein